VRLVAQPAVAHAQSYAGQPGAKNVGASKRVEIEPGNKNGFLDAIFCSPIVSKDALAKAECHRAMPNDQLRECGAVPFSSALNKSGRAVVGANGHLIRRIVATGLRWVTSELQPASGPPTGVPYHAGGGR